MLDTAHSPGLPRIHTALAVASARDSSTVPTPSTASAAHGIYVCTYPLIKKPPPTTKNPITDKVFGMEVEETAFLAGGLKYLPFIVLPTHSTNMSAHENHSVKFSRLISQRY